MEFSLCSLTPPPTYGNKLKSLKVAKSKDCVMFCVMLHVMVWVSNVVCDGVSDVVSCLVDVGVME